MMTVMDQVLMEMQRPNGTWVEIGSVSEVEPPGSVSSSGPGRRQVLVFGWHEGAPGVWESRAGVDVANDLARVIATIGLDLQSDLAEPYYVEIYRSGLRMQLRFSLLVTDTLGGAP